MAETRYRFLGIVGRISAWLSLCAVVTLLAAPANAQKKPATNPVGAGWDSKVKSAESAGGQTFTDEQSAAIQAVNTYFNDLQNLQGRFIQLDPDKKKTKGKFYVNKPGKFRFDYARPSRKIVVSDGRFLAIQDLDLRNEDVYELDNTPFRILLRADVDLLRDARIIQVEHSPEAISVTLSDKDPDAAGQLTVILTRQPEVTLAGWVTYDAQGLQTKVDVSDLTKPEKLESSLFKRKEFFKDAVKQ